MPDTEVHFAKQGQMQQRREALSQEGKPLRQCAAMHRMHPNAKTVRQAQLLKNRLKSHEVRMLKRRKLRGQTPTPAGFAKKDQMPRVLQGYPAGIPRPKASAFSMSLIYPAACNEDKIKTPILLSSYRFLYASCCR